MSIRILLMNAAIGALYAGLTLFLAPLSYGPVQVRLSECMVLLAFYNKRWIPGLVVGCFLANIGSPFGLTDMVVGTFATLIAVCGMRFCRALWQASLVPVFANGIIIGLELAYLAEIPRDAASILSVMAYIGLGEFLAVSIVGTVLMKLLLRNPVLKEYIGEIRN